MQTRRVIFIASILIVASIIGLLALRPALATVIAQVSNPTAGDGDLQPATLTSPHIEMAPVAQHDPDPNLSYYSILGAQMQPRASDTEFVYDGNGCGHVTSAIDGYLSFPVNLPEGSVIKYVTIFYIDNSDFYYNGVWLKRFIPGVSNTTLAYIESTGDTGYGSNQSEEITHIFSGAGAQYTINYGWNTTDGSTQICGIQVEYYAPNPSTTYLPAIRK